MTRASAPFLVVELSGRLGNQLFQFASGLGIARRAGARLVCTAPRVSVEDLLLPRLIGDAYVEATRRDLLRVGKLDSRLRPQALWSSAVYHGAHAIRRATGRTGPSVTLWENTGLFRPAVFDLDLPVYLQGHLQSERYFAAHAEELQAAFRWPTDAPRLSSAATPTVGVSFRRGDYNALGWTLPLDYYDRAMDLVEQRLGPVTFVLFGDDREFVELVVGRFARRGAVVDALTLAEDPIAQLYLLSQCDHCVMSNSSFAWWGAWIGDQQKAAGRLVIAPEEYRGVDRVPDRWTTLVTGVPET